MLSGAIWITGIVLEALLLLRGLQLRLVPRYSNFYIYILSLFLADGIVYAGDLIKHPVPAKWSWDLGFVSLFLGCGVALEIFRHVLSAYPGAEKFARVASYALLACVVAFAVIYPIISPSEKTARAVFSRAQRDFIAVQALALLVIIHVMLYYSIPAGRNLKGMILGYGQALSLSLVAQAILSYFGRVAYTKANYLQQASYLAALVIWLIALWSYLPNPRPNTRIRSDDDYNALASRTRGMVEAAESNLVKVERL